MQPQTTEATSRSRLLLVLSLLIVTVLSATNFTAFYVGFMSSDDGIYVSAARSLLEQGNHLPTHHWGFRYPVLFPIAAIESVIARPPEIAYFLIPLAFSIALAISVVVFAWANIGGRAAVVAGLLFSTMPLIVVQSSIINADIVESLFLFLSLAFFFAAARPQAATRARWLFFSGVALAAAMLTRETAYGFLLVYGLLFLAGAYLSRINYLWGVFGCLLVVAVEMGYYVASGESPFYRFLTIAQSHGTLGLTSTDFQPGTGNATDNRWLGPVVALLVNQEFGLLLYLAALALVWLKLEGCSTASDDRILRLFLFAALVFFVWLGYNGAIRPLPRYYMFVAVLAVIPVAVFVQRTRFRVIAFLMIAGLIASNYLALAVENLYPRFAAIQVVALAGTERLPIVTDPETAQRARQYASFLRSPDEDRISSTPPPESSFTLVEVGGQEIKDVDLANRIDAARAAGALHLVKEIQPPKLLIGHILDLTGFSSLLTEAQYRWLAIRNPKIQVFRVDLDPRV